MDGKHIASGSRDKTIGVFLAENGVCNFERNREGLKRTQTLWSHQKKKKNPSTFHPPPSLLLAYLLFAHLLSSRLVLCKGDEVARIDDNNNWIQCVAFTKQNFLLAGGLEEILRIFGTALLHRSPIFSLYPLYHIYIYILFFTDSVCNQTASTNTHSKNSMDASEHFVVLKECTGDLGWAIEDFKTDCKARLEMGKCEK